MGWYLPLEEIKVPVTAETLSRLMERDWAWEARARNKPPVDEVRSVKSTLRVQKSTALDDGALAGIRALVASNPTDPQQVLANDEQALEQALIADGLPPEEAKVERLTQQRGLKLDRDPDPVFHEIRLGTDLRRLKGADGDLSDLINAIRAREMVAQGTVVGQLAEGPDVIVGECFVCGRDCSGGVCSERCAAAIDHEGKTIDHKTGKKCGPLRPYRNQKTLPEYHRAKETNDVAEKRYPGGCNKPLAYKKPDESRPLSTLGNGFAIGCAHCKRTFSSRGLRCCSAACEDKLLKAQKTAEELAEAGMERMYVHRKCEQCGNDIPRYSGEGKNRRETRKDARYCSQSCANAASKKRGRSDQKMPKIDRTGQMDVSHDLATIDPSEVPVLQPLDHRGSVYEASRET